ncbi:MAG TPA: sigma-70 family RNA polymerase sigma factor [Haloferula sp.]
MAVPDPDADLLAAFVRDRDEAAFRALAGRYLGLVFHAAMRRTGNRPLAEEISQNILCALAAKAGSLVKHPDRLPAWLHRATLYESAKAMRSEASRRRREQHATIHSTPAPDSESQWIDALPHLDLALDRLGESDRTLLLLHFYEGRSFPRIAGLLGKTTAAVQKQSQRALEKLARVLRGKGVTLSVTALIAGLGSEFAKAAPLAVLQSTTTAAMTSAAGMTGKLPWLMTTPSKALVPAALLIVAVPLALQEAAISKLTEKAATASTSHASASTSTTRTAKSSTSRSVLSNSFSLVTLLREQEDATHVGEPLTSAFIEKLTKLDPQKWTDLVKQTSECRAAFGPKAYLMKSLLDAMTVTDAKFALTTVFEAFHDKGNFEGWMIRLELSRSFSKWTGEDPGGAWRWMQAQQAAGKLKHTEDEGMMEDLISQGEESLLWEMLTQQLPERNDFIRSLDQENLRHNLAQAGYTYGGLPDENGKGDLSWAKVLMQAARDYLPASEQAKSLDDLASVVEMHCINLDREFQLTELTPVFLAAGLTPQELEIGARSQALAFIKHASSKKKGAPDPAAARKSTEAWLREIIPGKAGQIMRDVLLEAEKPKQQEAPAK